MKFLAPNIVIDGGHIRNPINREHYERSVEQVGDHIRTSAFGSAFLDLVGNNSQPIVIAPTARRDEVDTHSVDAVKSFAEGFQFQNKKGETKTGTGVGATTVIDFTPSGNVGKSAPDIILIHELGHAWRQARGKWRPLPITDFFDPAQIANPGVERWRFPNWEEFLGVVIEGIYAAEQGAAMVRTAQGEGGLFWAVRLAPQAPNIFNPLPMTDSQTFAEKFRRALIRIMSEEQDLYKLMLQSNAWFNPVRDMARMSAYKSNTVVPTPPTSTIFSQPGSVL